MTLRTGNLKKGLGLSVQGLSDKTRKDQNPNPHTLTPKSGLTLIEVLLAVSILAIGTIGVLRAFAGSVATLEVGQFSIDSVGILKQKITDIKIMQLEQGDSAPSSDRGEEEDFLWEWSIRSTAVEGLNELNLLVSHKVNPRELSIKTYVVDPKDEEEL